LFTTSCKRSRPARQRKAFPLGVESLEERRVLTSANLANGVLQVLGTSLADTIVVRQIDGRISVDGTLIRTTTGLNVPAVYSSSVLKITVLADGGNDKVDLNSEAVTGQQAITAPALIYGASGNDSIWGGAAADAIFGGDNDDQLWGNAGNDFIDGGAGNDSIWGGTGNDRLFGDVGSDHLAGEDGNDCLNGGDHADSLYGGTGRDTLDGARGADTLYGQEDADYLYDDATGNTIPVGAGDTRVVDHLGWFDMNLQDATVRSAVRYAADDWNVDRKEMLDVFDQVRRDNVVTAAELADLQLIVASPADVPMAAPVRELSRKVVGDDPANAHYQGVALGDLAAGSTGTQLGRLVNKWFRGTDHPVAIDFWDHSISYSYERAGGSLFQNGISREDIKQGGVGDCYFMAGLAETAQHRPDLIQHMFSDNGDNTFTVRFYNNGVADYVTVDRYLPVDASHHFVFANYGALASNTANELWVALAEKAYAQANESGWIYQDGTNSYNGTGADSSDGINGGSPGRAMEQLTGKTATSKLTATTTADDLLAAFNAGRMVTFSSKDADSLVDPDVVGNHAYALAGYDASTGKFKLFNPWGVNGGTEDGVFKPGYIELTWDEIQANFANWQEVTP
jgi:hypothetical protein